MWQDKARSHWSAMEARLRLIDGLLWEARAAAGAPGPMARPEDYLDLIRRDLNRWMHPDGPLRKFGDAHTDVQLLRRDYAHLRGQLSDFAVSVGQLRACIEGRLVPWPDRVRLHRLVHHTLGKTLQAHVRNYAYHLRSYVLLQREKLLACEVPVRL